MLESSLLSDGGDAPNPEFVDWVSDYVPFVHVTTHLYDEPYHDLLADRGGFGFPTLAFLDSHGQLLALHEGPRTIEGLEATAGEAARRQEQAERAAEGDGEAAFELAVYRLEAEAMSLAEAEEVYADLEDELTEEQRSRLRQALVNKEVTEAVQGMLREHGRTGTLERAPAEAAKWFRAGKIPTNAYASFLFGAALQHAQATEDRELAEALVAELETRSDDDPRLERVLEQARENLETWK